MSPNYLYVILALIGILPSLIWLNLYLRKDSHPEPRAMILKTFLMGIMIAPAVLLLQLLFVQAAESLCACAVGTRSPEFFLWGAGVEELFKFLAVYIVAIRSPAFDEPIDAMIYLITAALGFAAMENMIYLARTVQQGLTMDYSLVQHIQAALAVWTLRFTGATLLHTLSSAIAGYFLAMSWFYRHHAKPLIIMGLAVATLFHFAFNVFVSLPGNQSEITALALSTTLLLIMAFLVSVLFDKIRERYAQSVRTI
ncbi:MAG: PrsW family intramembrane metalloprotease [Patescibacteria group bacterium]